MQKSIDLKMQNCLNFTSKLSETLPDKIVDVFIPYIMTKNQKSILDPLCGRKGINQMSKKLFTITIFNFFKPIYLPHISYSIVNLDGNDYCRVLNRPE